jgi:DNA-binding SARP family transcriptional activator/ABC-type branched-subunit amino acid transport system substrate-binding protein
MELNVEVFLVGRVAVEADGVLIDEARFPGRQGRLLFAYLVAELGRPVPRDELAEALWGESPPATWDKALAVLVSKLRGLLADCGLDGANVLTSAFGCYRLDLPADSWVDVIATADAVQEAEAALAAGDFENATAAAALAESLVQKPFLPGEDGTWVEGKRRELTGVRDRALTVLAVASLRLGDATEAAQWAEKAIALEPFRETGYRRLMEAHAAAGNRAEALRVYDRCRRLLAEELGAYPSPETESIYRDLLKVPAAQTAEASVAASPPPPASPKPRRARRRSVLMVAGGLLVAAAVAVGASQLSEGRKANPARLRTIASARCSALNYEGAGSPQFLIAGDVPLQPGALETTTPMVNAMALALERRNYKAGPYRVGLQVCDDATAGGVPGFDTGRCIANAREYARNRSVIGVVGPLVSACAMLEIPILNRARGGAVSIVSPSTTYVGLTRRVGPGDPDQPGVFYPTGRRNYARVLPADDVQAAADAILARRLGAKRVYALDDGEPIGRLFVDDFVRAARRLGLAVAGRGSWDVRQRSYASLAGAIAQTGADDVFLGVPSRPESIRLLRDLRARLGRAVQFMAPEVFDPAAARLAGRAAEGMTISQPGPPNDQLTGEGKQFVASFSKKFGAEPSRYAVAAAQAMDVLLDAIAQSDGSRASVTSNLFTTRVSNGILGSFWITPTGDTTLNAVAIYRIVRGKATTFATVVVPDALMGSG